MIRLDRERGGGTGRSGSRFADDGAGRVDGFEGLACDTRLGVGLMMLRVVVYGNGGVCTMRTMRRIGMDHKERGACTDQKGLMQTDGTARDTSRRKGCMRRGVVLRAE